MRREVEIWWEQSKYDFETAEVNFREKRYSVSVFFVQQALEKGFKAVYILKLKESPGITHSLIMLADKTNFPKDKFTFLKELTPEFISTRYPDYVGEIPYTLYDEEIADKYLSGAKEVIKWLKEQMSKQN